MTNWFLAVLGAAAVVHLLCIANFTPKKAPVSISLEIGFGVGFAAGMFISAVQGDESQAIQFGCLFGLAMFAYSVDRRFRVGHVYDIEERAFENTFASTHNHT